MDKFQAINYFWSGFGLPVYDEQDIPDDAVMPYITYKASADSLGNSLLLYGNLWYRENTWKNISKKAQDIEKAIKEHGYVLINTSEPKGYLKISAETPFAQRMKDDDEVVKRIYLNINAEFLTAY
jgi:hypothetical protein